MDAKDVKYFLSFYPSNMSYPLGGDLPIPTEKESSFLDLISTHEITRRDEVLSTANSLGTKECYFLVAFSVRNGHPFGRTFTMFDL